MSTFIQRLERSGAGQALLAEERAATLAHRAKLAAQLEALKASHMAEVTPLVKAEADAKARLVRAEEAVQVARKGLGQAQIALGGVANSYTHRVGELERGLTLTAPAIITEFTAKLRNVLDKVGREVINVPSGRGRPRPEDTKRLQEAVAKRDARVRRIMAIIHEVEGLKLEALDDGELAAKLNAMRKLVEA